MTHLYLQDTLARFVPWEKHRDRTQNLPGGDQAAEAPYTKDDVLAYIAFCRQAVDEQVLSVDLGAASGFH